MVIKFTEDIEIRVENVHIQKRSDGTYVWNRRFLLSMDDGMYYLFDLNSKTIRKYDDYNKIPDVLKDI